MLNIVLINNSSTAWPNKMLMPFLHFSDNLLQDAYIIFQKGVDSFSDSVENKLNFGLGFSSP